MIHLEAYGLEASAKNRYVNGAWNPSAVKIRYADTEAALVRDLTTSPVNFTPGIDRLMAEAKAAGQLMIVGGLVTAGLDPTQALETAQATPTYRVGSAPGSSMIHLQSGAQLESVMTKLQPEYSSAPGSRTPTEHGLEVARLGVATVALSEQVQTFCRQQNTAKAVAEDNPDETLGYVSSATASNNGMRLMQRAFQPGLPIPQDIGVMVSCRPGASGSMALKGITFTTSFPSPLLEQTSHINRYEIEEGAEGSLTVAYSALRLHNTVHNGLAYPESAAAFPIEDTSLAAVALWAHNTAQATL